MSNIKSFADISKIRDFPVWLAVKHHKTHRNQFLNFETHFYQKQIYLDHSPYLVVIKSTQNGLTEYLLVRAIAHAVHGMRIFYVLPTFELVKRCVDERFTKSVQNTNYYRLLVRAAKEEQDMKMAESVKSKDIGNGNITFVNSGSATGFTEYSADEYIIDELDRCDPINILMCEDRIAHSEYRWKTKISNPTYKGLGIDAEYENTDKMEYYQKCEFGHWNRLDWFEHIVRAIDDDRYIIRDPDFDKTGVNDIRPICKCERPIDRWAPGIWHPSIESDKRGYRLTKLFSGTVTIVEMMERFMAGLYNDDIMQRFYNADLGEAYTAKGAKIDREMILDCVRNYSFEMEDGAIIAGIDVGKLYNFVIKKILPSGELKTLMVGEVQNTDELIAILKKFKIKAGVIDGMPETREARKIANKFPLMFLCWFGQTKADSIDVQKKIITVQRTPAIDAVKEAVLTNTILYPINIQSDENFITQMTSSVRVFNPDKRLGGQKGVYEWIEERNLPDHYLLATAYCLIARRLMILLNKG